MLRYFGLRPTTEVKDVLKVFEMIRDTQSINKKQELLERLKDSDLTKLILNLAYNKHKKFKLTNKTLNGSYDESTTLQYNNFLRLAVALSENNINNNLRNQANIFLASIENEELRELYKMILLKDLKLGMNVKSINKVFENLIPLSNIEGIDASPMLADKFIFDKPLKRKGILTEKLDGIRNWALVDKNERKVVLVSRQGKKIEGCIEIENELLNLIDQVDDDFLLLDGELLAKDCDYENVFKETTKRVKNKKEYKTGIRFHIFDILTRQEYENKKGEISYLLRRKKLDALGSLLSVLNCDSLAIVPVVYMTTGEDDEIILNILDRYRLLGAEGLMWNDLDGVYEFKRSKNILKLKVMQTADLRIVGFEEGKGKLENTLGSILVDYKGFVVGAGIKGSFELRKHIWENQDEYLNKIAEIQFFEETKNKKGDLSLRFAVFKYLREDKEEPSYF